MASIDGFINVISKAGEIILFGPAEILIPVASELSDDSLIFHQPLKILDPANIINALSNTMSNTFTDIWMWLLLNILSPLIMIVFLILFFAGQFLLFRFYIYIFKALFPYIKSLWNLFKRTQEYKILRSMYSDVLK